MGIHEPAHTDNTETQCSDGLGAPTPGDAADGVVVAAPAPQGISSALEALAALHRKGALTDGEFAAAKAKLLLLG